MQSHLNFLEQKASAEIMNPEVTQVNYLLCELSTQAI